MKHDRCALCGNPGDGNSIVDGLEFFCCTGCRAVYRILEGQKALSNFREHPVFQEALKAGLISNANLLAENLDIPEHEWQTLHLDVEDMWCPACAEIIKLMLQQKKGVRAAVVDYATDLASVEYSPRYLGKEEIYQTIQGLGYQVRPLEAAGKKKVGFQLMFRFVVAAFCTANVMMLSYPIYASQFHVDDGGGAELFAKISLLLCLPVLLFSAYPIYKRAFHSLFVGVVGMESLVTLGVSAAFVLSVKNIYQGSTHIYLDSMSAIVTFILLGKIIESRAKFSAREALFRLQRSLPRRGRLKREDGTEEYVLVKDIQVGQEFVVLMGEQCVLDGEVVSGKALLDESLMTGESKPVLKAVGDTIVGGSSVRSGSVTVRVGCSEEGSLLKQIVRRVESDMQKKAPYQRAADKVTPYIVPAVLIIAVGVSFYLSFSHASLDEVAERFMAICLISCPCALGIAAPLAESLLLSRLASDGVIVRNRGCLQYLGRETVLLSDKTGTLTEGCYRVLSGLSDLNALEQRILKGMAARSIHPVSRAIYQALEGPEETLNVVEYPGLGLKSGEYKLGSSLFLGGEERPGVGFAKGDEVIAWVELGDRLRDGAKDFAKGLNGVLLSGDAQASVIHVARESGFSEYHFRQSPMDKRAFVQKLKDAGEVVGMLGDGINDAPALAASHCSCSVVSASDVSIQVSDLLLTSSSLRAYPKARRFAAFGRAIIAQNLFWAFFYNIVGVGLAAFGVLNPLFSAFAMVASSLIVTFNAMRLR